MALVLLHQGEQAMLEAFVNKTAPQTLIAKLFVTNVTPAKTDTESSYTEATGGGYVTKTCTPGDWTWTSATPSHIDLPQADTIWTFTGPLTTNLVIYGYYLIQTTSGKAVWAEAISPTFQPASNGDQFKLTLILTLA